MNNLEFLNGKGSSKKWKIISAVIVVSLFLLVTWYYNKDNDQTKDISDAVKKQYEHMKE